MGGAELFAARPTYLKSPVVFWHNNGEPFSNFASHFHRKVKEVAKWAAANGVDFQRFTFHALRHLHAIEVLRAGYGTIFELKERLGHSTVKTTEEYLECGYLTSEQVQRARYGRTATPLPQAAAAGQ